MDYTVGDARERATGRPMDAGIDGATMGRGNDWQRNYSEELERNKDDDDDVQFERRARESLVAEASVLIPATNWPGILFGDFRRISP